MSDDPQTEIDIEAGPWTPLYLGMLPGSTVAVPVFDSNAAPQVGETVEVVAEDGRTYQGQVVLVQYVVRVDCLKEG